MERLEGVSDKRAGLIARIAFWFCRRKVGEVTTPLRIVAHHGRLLRATGSMEMGQLKAREVDPALKALVSVMVATQVGCPF